MIVSVSTFYEELNEYQPELIQGQVKTIQYFRPIYHGIENGFSTENLYIGLMSQLPEIPPDVPCCYMLVEDCMLPDFYKVSVQNTYLLLSKEYRNLDLFALSSGIFENQVMVGLLSADLLGSVKKKAELDVILLQGYEVLQIPLVLIDRSFNILACTDFEHAELSVSFLHKLFEKDNQIPTISSKEYINYEMSTDSGYFIAGRIMRDSSPSAYLIGLINGNRINDRIRKLFQILCNFLELRMQNDIMYRPDLYSSGNAFLHGIICGKYNDPDRIARHQERLGLRFYDFLFVIALEHRDGSSTDDQLHLLHFRLNSILGPYYWITKNGRLLILYDKKEKDPFTHIQQEHLQQFLEETDFRAVISLPFSSLDEFAASCGQTLAGMSVLQQKKDERRIVFYENIMIDHMLLNYGEIINLEKLVPDYIWKLHAMDKEKNYGFVHTLFTYIEHNLNMTQTAEALYIHYNTLKHRINRILELTGADLTSPNVVLRLFLAKQVFSLLTEQHLI